MKSEFERKSTLSASNKGKNFSERIRGGEGGDVSAEDDGYQQAAKL